MGETFINITACILIYSRGQKGETRIDYGCQIAQEMAKLDAARIRLLEVEYRYGGGDSNNYLSSLNGLDSTKAQAYRAWAGMRSRIE